jgi:hypothetical protein
MQRLLYSLLSKKEEQHARPKRAGKKGKEKRVFCAALGKVGQKNGRKI